jgi:hypothetical protein
MELIYLTLSLIRNIVITINKLNNSKYVMKLSNDDDDDDDDC